MQNNEIVNKLSVSEEPIDFFELLKRDYGITRVKDRVFQANIQGVIFKGSLASVLSAVRGEEPGIWGNP